LASFYFGSLIFLKLEPQSLLQKSSSYNLYTVASNSAAAGFIENFDLVIHKSWLPSEEFYLERNQSG
jgi:hypothetical protein